MRTLEQLWNIILEKVENKTNPSVIDAVIESKMSEEEADAIFRDGLNDENDYNNVLNFVNSRVKFHRQTINRRSTH